jgi:hypothetical protein
MRRVQHGISLGTGSFWLASKERSPGFGSTVSLRPEAASRLKLVIAGS